MFASGKLDMSKPEEMMKLTKKGKTVMMFVRVNQFVDREETEQITSIWQTGLYNNHVQVPGTYLSFSQRINMVKKELLVSRV